MSKSSLLLQLRYSMVESEKDLLDSINSSRPLRKLIWYRVPSKLSNLTEENEMPIENLEFYSEIPKDTVESKAGKEFDIGRENQDTIVQITKSKMETNKNLSLLQKVTMVNTFAKCLNQPRIPLQPMQQCENRTIESHKNTRKNREEMYDHSMEIPKAKERLKIFLSSFRPEYEDQNIADIENRVSEIVLMDNVIKKPQLNAKTTSNRLLKLYR